MVRGAEDILTRAGYTLIIGNSDNELAKEEAYYRTFLERQVEGLLTVPTCEKAPESLNRLRERGIPIVYVDRFHAGVSADIVMAENREASQHCVQHLVAQGRRRIAIITGPLQLSNAREQLEGYRSALNMARLPMTRALVREGQFDHASGLACAQGLLSVRPRPDAIFCSNGLMACGALEAIEKAGLVCPDNIALA